VTVTWAVVALVFFAMAIILATADGALLATGHAAPRRIIAEPERAHRALSMGRVLAHLVTGTALALTAAGISPVDRIAIPIAIVLLLLHVTLVEGAARAGGYARGMAAVDRLAPIIYVVDLLFVPVTWVGGAVERLLSRALPPADESSVQREEGAEQFREVVAAEADVSAAEEELLHGVFSLGDTQVEEIMVPRVDVVGIEKGTPWTEVLDRVRSSEHARFPVFEETLDNVVGILYAKDLLPAVAGQETLDDWSPFIRPAQFIPATKTIDQQLRDFKAQRTHIALVMDEYGGTAGLVTIENILEEIVGEIRDEYDEEEPSIEQEGRERFWVSGTVTLADLSELVGTDFQREDLKTVAGLIYDAFGRVPRPGEAKEIDGFRIVVERVKRRRIERVYLERTAPSTRDEDA